jgi:hypothetical protein
VSARYFVGGLWRDHGASVGSALYFVWGPGELRLCTLGSSPWPLSGPHQHHWSATSEGDYAVQTLSCSMSSSRQPRPHKPRKPRNAVITHRSSVSIVKSQNGRQRVKKYRVNHAPEMSSAATAHANRTNQVLSSTLMASTTASPVVNVTNLGASQKKSKVSNHTLTGTL